MFEKPVELFACHRCPVLRCSFSKEIGRDFAVMGATLRIVAL